MKTWLRRLRHGRKSALEAELIASRPAPPESLVQAIVARVRPQPVATRSSRGRLGYAAVLTAALVAVVAATGGLSYAATAISGAAKSVVHATSPSTRSASPTILAACSQYAVPPVVTSRSPFAGPSGTPVSIGGSHFSGINAVTAVRFASNQSAAYRVVSDTSVAATVPANAITGAITVYNCAGHASSAIFTVRPKITSFTPLAGTAGQVVVIYGTGFVSGRTIVKFHGVTSPKVTFYSTQKVTAVVPATASTGRITATTSGATSGTATSASNFTVRPKITSFSPLAGTATQTVVIYGNGFVNGHTVVKFHGVTSSSVTFVSSQQIKAVVPATATTGRITATTTGSTSGTATSPLNFTVRPKITGFTPLSAKRGAKVTIFGYGFVKGHTVVKFHGVTSGSVGFVSTQKITAVVPAKATTGKITVTTSGATSGTATSPKSFTVKAGAAPKITSFSPRSGKVGTVVKIYGRNFKHVLSVTIGGKSAKFHVVSSRKITARVPFGAKSGTIVVVTRSGKATTAKTRRPTFRVKH